MTYDEVKKLLKDLSENKRLLRVIQKEIQEAREQAMLIPALNYDNVRVKGGENTPAQLRFIEHLERLEKRFNKVFEKVCQAEDTISNNLQSLTPIEQAIIIERYMHGKSWRTLQNEYNYSPEGVYKIHSRAVKKLSNE